MRLARLLAAAALAAAAFSTAPASAAQDCHVHPENCYECVMYPCYPSDWPPFLLGQVNQALNGEAYVEVNTPVVCVDEPCEQEPLVYACVYRLEMCTAE